MRRIKEMRQRRSTCGTRRRSVDRVRSPYVAPARSPYRLPPHLRRPMETTPSNQAAPSGRLDSWKEIAAYLKRDVRTVQRWEKDEGLPVHRLQHGKQGSVYAQAPELDAWWESRRRDLEKPVESRIPRTRSTIAVAVVVVALTIAAVLLWIVGPWSRKTSLNGSVYQFQIALDDNAGFGVAVSPDGRRIAFDTCCTNLRIWVHDLTAGTTSPVRNTEGGSDPSWSPDGSQVVFKAGRTLKIVDLVGGPSVTVADAPLGAGPASWQANGILFSTSTGIAYVRPPGGMIQPLILEDGAGARAVRNSPRWLPDGRHFIYHAWYANGHSAEYVATLESRQAERLMESDFPALFAAPSMLLFLKGTALMAQPFDPESQHLMGTAAVIASDVAPGSLATMPRFAASDNGVLAFIGTRGGRAGQLTWFDRLGRETGRIAQPDGVDYLNPSISPDGRFVAVNRMDPQTAKWDVWVIDLARNVPTRVTFDDTDDSDPVWSPDSRQIVFRSMRGGHLSLYRMTVGQQAELLLVDESAQPALGMLPSDWSPDGRYIVYTRWPVWGVSEIWRAPVADGKPELVVPPGTLVYDGRVSPDGRWIAYSSLESGSLEIYVRPFGAPGEKQQISNGGGVHPRWTADGREIVYWTPPRGLAAASISVNGARLAAEAPRTILQTPILTLMDARTHWDMTRDGTRLLARVASGGAQPSITVVVNWPERLKRR